MRERRAARTTDIAQAREILKQKRAEIEAAKAGLVQLPGAESRRATVSQLTEALKADYVLKDRRSIKGVTSHLTGEAFRVRGIGRGEHSLPRGDPLLGQAVMHVVGRQQAEAGVPVLGVVPGEEDEAVAARARWATTPTQERK